MAKRVGAHLLSDLQVKRAKHGRHVDGAGLHLVVSETGAKSWVLRVQVLGRRRDIGLGGLTDLTLAEARDKSAALRKIARAGGDPIAARDKAKTSIPTFKQAAEACHALKAPAAGSSSGCALVTRDVAMAMLKTPANYYVNVHNAAFPGGAVRGQLGK